MLLLVDENVPNSVANVFIRRGHEVKFVRDLFPAGSPDPVVAAVGDQMSAIVVTWDRDFDSLVTRIPKGKRAKFRRLGRISFRCDYANGAQQLDRWIPQIELLYEQALTQKDFRLIVEIQSNAIRMM